MSVKIAMGSWAFTFGPYANNPIPFEAVVKRLAAAGYDGVEASGYPPHITLEAYAGGRKRRGLRELLVDHDLELSGYSADFSACNPVIPDHREEYLDLFRRQTELCREIGAPLIRVDTVAAPGSIVDADYEDSFARLADLWHDASELAAADGVKVVWECEPGFVFNKPSEAVAMHERVNHPNFSLLFDTAHAYLTAVVGARQHGRRETVPGGILAYLEGIHARVGHVHLVDSDGTLYGDETSTHIPLGEGQIDFRALAPFLLSLKQVGWWCIDLSFCPCAWDLVEPALAFVEDLIDGRDAA